MKGSGYAPLAGISKPWGARRGASGSRYRPMTGHVERPKLLVEPLPAMSCDGPEMYGMQEVRGSTPLNSTFPQVKLML
jgi:hypothetical protein